MAKNDAPNIPGMASPKKAAQAPPKQQAAALPQPTGDDDYYEEDFTEVSTGGFTMANEGYHHAKVIDFERGESKGGNPQYVWQFRIIAGPSKDVEIRAWTSLLPNARWKTVEALEAVGIEAGGTMARFRRSELIGKPCILEVIHDEYDGKTNHKVDKFHPPNDETLSFLEQEAPEPF